MHRAVVHRKFRALSAVILPPDPRLRLGPPLTTPSKRVRRGRRPFGYSEFKPEGRPMKITPEIRAEVDRLRRDRHLSDRSIARLFGISPTTIGTIPRRPR